MPICAGLSMSKGRGPGSAARCEHAIDHHAGLRWDANISCVSKSRKSVLWACSWRSRPTDIPGAATVKFWATSSGWHTRVTIIAQSTANNGYH